MREIKFRAWHKEWKKVYPVRWFTTHPPHINNGGLKEVWCDLTGDWNAATPFEGGLIELMQYTGLKDKNGWEIYEGDILRLGIGGDDLYEMRWVCAGFWLINPIRDDVEPVPNVIAEAEVIRNIYEKPELLQDAG